MPLNDVYEVTDTQTLYGQEVQNVYQYRQAVIFGQVYDTFAQSLAEAWIEQVLPAVAALQTGDLVHTNITVRNLFNDADSYTEDISVAGTYGASSFNTAPAFTAVPFVLGGTNSAVKNGSKRIAGFSNAEVSDGVFLASFYTALNAAADQYEAPLTLGELVPGDIWLPIIVKRVRSGAPGAYEYRMPENVGELVFSLITSVIWDAIASTQISRKIGVGQ